MQKTNILYGVIGLLAGLLIGGSIGLIRNNDRYSREDVHQMSNGTVMKNSSMNMDMA
jgi:multisubunit Na+/H+ antiporter MnhG subunit